MGLFGFLKLGKKREGAISTLAAAAAQEEPEFLKEIDTATAGKLAENAIKEEVEPELALWLSNGTTVKSLTELAAALKKLGAKDYKEHVNKERNEIADWAEEVLNDGSLARQLRRAKTKAKAAQAVESEIKKLKAARTSGKARRAAAKSEVPEEGIQIPEIPELTPRLPTPEEPEEPKAAAKQKLSFWPFKERRETKEPELTEMLPTPAGAFETEPHHEKWEELPAQDELLLGKIEEAEEIEMPEEGPGLSREARELEQMENEMEREEEELNMKRLALTRRRYELIKRRGDLDKRRFEDFIRRQKEATEREGSLAKENVSLPAGEESRGTRLEGMPDFRLAAAYGKERLVALLEEAKQHIHENNFDEAQKALGEIQAVFNTVYMPANEKKQIEYEILEVEHDLKLASLRQ